MCFFGNCRTLALKLHETRISQTDVKIFSIQSAISPKAFRLEKCYCAFWKGQKLSFTMMQVTSASDKDYGF